MTDYHGHDLEALADLPNYQRYIAATFGTALGGKVLEVGAGIGSFSSTWVPRATRAVLVEPAPHLHARLAVRFATSAHVSALCATVAQARQQQPSLFALASFDAVVMVNVLEHIADDVGALRELAGLLAPGGQLLLFVPALPFLFGTLDESVAHVRRYTRTQLVATVTAAGFAPKEVRFLDVLGIVPWLLAGRVFGLRRFDARGAGLYDRFGVPLTALLEKRWRLPIGKNLLCVCDVDAAAHPAGY